MQRAFGPFDRQFSFRRQPLMTKSGSKAGQSASQWKPYRSSHREKSHRAAHETGTNGQPPPVLDHPRVPAGPPVILRDGSALRELIARLRDAGVFAYDSEFIGEHTYHPRLCLIQVATADHVALIDPLDGVDLTPFWELIADESVQTIVHAGVPDLEPVMRHLGRPPGNVFDTQIAAAFLGHHYPSALGRLVEPMLGADLGQGLKFSQWDQRPLTPAQLIYAANDVRYLPLLREVLVERLTERSRLDWAIEECATLCDPALYVSDLQSMYARFRGGDALSTRQQGVLLALIEWREAAALEHDVPPRALVRDDVLASIARSAPTQAAQLKHVRGLPRPVREMYGQAILETIAGAGKSNPFARPDYARWRTEELKPAIDALLAAIQDHCTREGLTAAIVTSRKDATRLACRLAEGKPVDTCRLVRGWRGQFLGPLLRDWARTHGLEWGE